MVGLLFVFKQNTAYEMRISDWSSDVCSSDLKRFNMANLGEWGVKPTAPTRGSARIRSGRNGWLGVGAVQAFDVAGQGGAVVGIQLLGDRKSVVEGKMVSVSVDLGGRRIMQKQQTTTSSCTKTSQSLTL